MTTEQITIDSLQDMIQTRNDRIKDLEEELEAAKEFEKGYDEMAKALDKIEDITRDVLSR